MASTRSSRRCTNARADRAVIACSALKEGTATVSRGVGAVDEVRIVYLKGDTAMIARVARCAQGIHTCRHRCWTASSAALEEPGDADRRRHPATDRGTGAANRRRAAIDVRFQPHD
jgi:gluconate kinase